MQERFVIGAVLKKIRTSKGVTQKQISHHTGISQSNYSKYELGKIDINSTYLLNIIDYLDISLPEFTFLCNEHKLSEKETILKDFFNIPYHEVDSLIKIKKTSKHFLTHTHSKLIEDISTLCDALIVIYVNNDYKTAETLARPIWNRLSNNNELYIYDLYFINAILYIFPESIKYFV